MELLTDELRLHPEAERIPRMPADQQADFVADVRQRGIRVPIEIIDDNVIVDGRGRWLAAKQLGIKQVRVIDAPIGDEPPVLYMLRAATKRRHLTVDQLACLALEEMEVLASLSRHERARLAGLAGGRGRSKSENSSAASSSAELSRDRAGDARAQVAARYCISEHRIRQAKHLKEQSPLLYKQVRHGTERLAVAKRQVERDAKRLRLRRQAARSHYGCATWDIRCGDCVDELRKMEPASARLVFADPPYNIGVDYGSGRAADQLSDEKYLAWCREWIAECVRILADDGSLWVMINDEYADYFGIVLREAGLTRRSWIKWYEAFGINCSNNFNRCSRHIFYCVKNSRQFVFDADAVMRPSARQTTYGDTRASPEGKLWDNVWMIPRLVENSRERLPDFPTQLPLQLVQPIVECATELGDLVIDPFCGSGTTGVAAMMSRRQFLGIETNRQFVADATARLSIVSAEASQAHGTCA